MPPLSSTKKTLESADDSVDVQKIGQLSQAEFKEQIQQWMEQQEGKMHAKLRKDLIESFSRTNLGRTLSAELQQKQGIVLSPLVLVLNTLVSEFLFSQNYHYTLCVFSSEVVFPHTLPDFSQPDNFRFSHDDLQEVLQALGLTPASKTLKDSILSCYDNDTSRSLLFAIIKCVIDEVKVERENCNKEVQVGRQRLNRDSFTDDQLPNESDCELIANVKNLSSLNRTIEKLSKSVKNMADHFEQVETSRRVAKSHQSTPQHRGAAKTVEPEDVHYANLMRHVQVISQKLDKYCVNFNNLEQKLNGARRSSGTEENDGRNTRSYKEWLRHMKESKHGKHFMEKLQRSLSRMWSEEKQKLRDIYDAEFQTVKKMLKARYKEELREQINARLNVRKEATEVNKEAIEEVLVNKMQNFETRDGELERRIEKLQEIVHEYKDDEVRKEDQIKRVARKLTETLKNVEKTVGKAPELLAQLNQANVTSTSPNESDVEQIIKTAKTRIRQLEEEGEKLEQLFSSYLERQQDRKQDIEMSRVQIWQRYQKDRQNLNNASALTVGHNRPGTLTTITQYSARKVSETGSDDVSPIMECAHKNFEVSNPFKSFNTATYLQKAHEKRLLEGPKVERLEAFRRLDREVETFKKQMTMMYPTGTSLTSRSIFGPPELSSAKSILRNTADINQTTHEIRKKFTTVPIIQIQDMETPPGSSTVLSSDKLDTDKKRVAISSDPTTRSEKSSIITKSEAINLNEASFDIELSKSSSNVSLSVKIDETQGKGVTDKCNNLLTPNDANKSIHATESESSDLKVDVNQIQTTRVLKPDELQVHQLPQSVTETPLDIVKDKSISDPSPESSIQEEVEELDIHLKKIDTEISEIDEKIQSLAEQESAHIDREIKQLDKEKQSEPLFSSLKSLDERKLESPSLVSNALGRLERPIFSASETKVTTLKIESQPPPSDRPRLEELAKYFKKVEDKIDRPQIAEISKYFSEVKDEAEKKAAVPTVNEEKNVEPNKTEIEKPDPKPAPSQSNPKPNQTKVDAAKDQDSSKRSLALDLTFSEDDSDNIVISTGKLSNSESSDDFWKQNNY